MGRVSVWEDKVLETGGGDGCTTVGIYLISLNSMPTNAKNG